MRILRHQMFMEIAWIAAKRSTCVRLNVGAVVTFRNRVVSLGWGGAPSGQPHCPGNTCPGMVPGNCPTIHAEKNALDFGRPIVPLDQCDIYTTHSPCSQCTDHIIRDRLRRVFFGVPYRADDVARLHEHGIQVYQVTHAGHLLNAVTGELLDQPL